MIRRATSPLPRRTRARFLAPFVTWVCAACGREFHRRRSQYRQVPRRPTCSRRCHERLPALGRGHRPLGTVVIRRGRAYVHVGVGHAAADSRGYAPRSRLVAADMLGRPLLPTERVFYRNGNKLDDAPENLVVCLIDLAFTAPDGLGA